jgi:hypothetical protein
MEFLIYGEDSTDELNIQELEETIEIAEEPENVSSALEVLPEPKELSPLEKEIREILGDASPDVLEQYKNMEDAIRRTYNELSALDLSPNVNRNPEGNDVGISNNTQDLRPNNGSHWNPAEIVERRRIRFLREHGVQLTSDIYKTAKKIQIPNAVLNQEYRKMLPRLKDSWKSDPELYSPESNSIPRIVAASPPQKRTWRPQSAAQVKKVTFEPTNVVEVPPLQQPRKVKKSTKKHKKKKKPKAYYWLT